MTAGLPLGVAFALAWIPMFLFRAETLTKALPRYSRSERLWVAVTPLVLAVHMTGVCTAISFRTQVGWWPAAVSLLLYTGAVAFWFWGRTMIGPLRLRRLPDEPPLRLQRHGAFGIVRHPLYFAYWLAAAAPLVIVPRPLFLLSFVVCSVALMVRAGQEERRLRAHVGEPYDDYCRAVKRLIPFVW